MELDDELIERYSRQIVLAEVGPRGQLRLAAARVAVVGDDDAAARVVAYLGAAGVGSIACAPGLHAMIDPERPHLTLATPDEPVATPLDAAVVTAATAAEASAHVADWRGRAAITLWTADGRAGASPPCPLCAASAAPAPDPEPSVLRAALLGTIVATEVVKTLLAIGSRLTGHVVAYDPGTAAVTRAACVARASCRCA